MAETSGSCAVPSQDIVMNFAPKTCSIMPRENRTFIDDLKDAYKHRQIAKQEARKNELIAKGDNLTTMEQVELAGLRTQENLERLAKLNSSTICYSC